MLSRLFFRRPSSLSPHSLRRPFFLLHHLLPHHHHIAMSRHQILTFAAARTNKLPLSVGHRGASEQWPENSIISMAQAVKDGADGLEGDLHLTADGEIIVMHDPSLDRTTNGTGLIKDRPWHGYIDGLKSKKEPHVGVPRCIDVLAFLAQDGNEKVWWNIDIKMNNSPWLLLSMFAKLMEDYFPGRDFSSQIVLGLWHPKFLAAADKYLPRFSRIHIGFSLPIAREHFPPSTVDGYSINFMILSTPAGRQFVKDMQAAGKQILTWTVNDSIEAREAVKIGVDYILTDRTKVLGDVLHEFETLGKDGVDLKYAAEAFDTWSRWSKYAFWRTLIWMFLTVKFNSATKQLDPEPEKILVK